MYLSPCQFVIEIKKARKRDTLAFHFHLLNYLFIFREIYAFFCFNSALSRQQSIRLIFNSFLKRQNKGAVWRQQLFFFFSALHTGFSFFLQFTLICTRVNCQLLCNNPEKIQ